MAEPSQPAQHPEPRSAPGALLSADDVARVVDRIAHQLIEKAGSALPIRGAGVDTPVHGGPDGAVPGTCVTVTLEGRRPLVTGVVTPREALVFGTALGVLAVAHAVAQHAARQERERQDPGRPLRRPLPGRRRAAGTGSRRS